MNCAVIYVYEEKLLFTSASKEKNSGKILELKLAESFPLTVTKLLYVPCCPACPHLSTEEEP